MCGIAAIINVTPDSESEIKYMLKQIEHRGDSCPRYKQLSNAMLGIARLEIVDIPNGSQPSFNKNKTIGIVFNGEIYNYKTLKNDLVDKGHSFYSDCDTEVILHLYEEFGFNFLHKLEGMFSFLIYDSNKNDFLGVRDFYGVKPFFFCQRNSTIYVSSEMKAFENLGVSEYQELKPGCLITSRGIEKYYQLPATTWHKDPTDQIAQRVSYLLTKAVWKRVQTNLPIGVFLSGGLDSSIVFLLASQFHANVKGIIIGENTSEDVIYAKRLCNDLGLPYHYVEIDKFDLANTIPEVVYTIESFEPNAIRGSVLSMKLGEAANKLGLKIVLCGEGSDEIFAGYGDFLNIQDEIEFQNKILNLIKDLYRTQLLRIDKTGMRHSVEVREPFLDRELVEYVLNIHPSLKTGLLNDGIKTTKLILREAFRNILPEYIYSRGKMTLMEGAGIGGVDKSKGFLFEYTNRLISTEDCERIKMAYRNYKIQNKEDAYYFKIFQQYYLKAKFATNRVINAQKEISQKECLSNY